MAATFPFELVSPERLLFSGDVEAVKLPGAEGEFQVMAGHAPVLALLHPGIMEITGGLSGTQRLFIDGGFCDMNGTRCTVLAEAAVPADAGAKDLVSRLIAETEAHAQTVQDDALDRAMKRLDTLKGLDAVF